VAYIHHHALRLDALHVPLPHDVLDGGQVVALVLAEDRGAEHRRLDALVDPHQRPAGLEPLEQVGHGGGLRGRLHRVGPVLDEVAHQLARLQVLAVDEPRLAGLHPGDLTRVDALLEQPHARIHGRLPGAEHHVAAGGLGFLHERVHRHAAGAVVDREARRVRGRDGALEVAGVHDLLADRDVGGGAGEAVREGGGAVAPILHVAHRSEGDLARREERLVHHLLEVVAHLGRGRPLVEPGVGPGVVDAILTEGSGRHAVERGRLVQPHERIRIVPVTPRPVPPVDHQHPGVGLGDEDVGERHPRQSGSDHQVVGVHRAVRHAGRR
jgi:hypothetical protein